MNEDKARLLFDALSEEYDMGEYEQFANDIKDTKKRQQLYDAISETYDVGKDFNDFTNRLGIIPEEEADYPKEVREKFHDPKNRGSKYKSIEEIYNDYDKEGYTKEQAKGIRSGMDAGASIGGSIGGLVGKPSDKSQGTEQTEPASTGAGIMESMKQRVQSTLAAARQAGQEAKNGETANTEQQMPQNEQKPQQNRIYVPNSPAMPDEKEKWMPFSQTPMPQSQKDVTTAVTAARERKQAASAPENLDWEDRMNAAQELATAEAMRKMSRKNFDAENFEDFYQSNLAPQFESAKAEAEKRAEKKGKEYEKPGITNPMTAPMANAFFGAVAHEQETDPQKVTAEAFASMDSGALPSYVYERMGINTKQEVPEGMVSVPMTEGEKAIMERLISDETNEVASKLQERMYEEYKNAGAQNSTLEYIASKAVRDSLIGRLTQSMIQFAAGSSGVREQLRQMAESEYGDTKSWGTRLVAGAVPFAVDLASGGFALPSMAGSLTKQGLLALASGGLKKGMSEAAVASTGRFLSQRAPALMVGIDAAAGMANFGTLGVQNEAVRQLGKGEFDGLELMKSFAEEAPIGGFFALGGALGQATRNAGKVTKVLADVGGLGLETAVFAGADGIREAIAEGKDVEDVDWAKTFGEAVGQVIGMKASGALLNPAGTMGALRERYSSSKKYKLDLNANDLYNLEDNGYNLWDIFKGAKDISDIAMSHEVKEKKNSKRDDYKVETKPDKLEELVNNPNITSDVKRKIVYLATGRILMPEKVYSADATMSEDGEDMFITRYNAAGDEIGTETIPVKDAEKTLKEYKDEGRENTINAIDVIASNYKTYLGLAEKEYRKTHPFGTETPGEREEIEAIAREMGKQGRDHVVGGSAEYVKEQTGIDVQEVLKKKAADRTPAEDAALDMFIKSMQDIFQQDAYRRAIETADYAGDAVAEGMQAGKAAMTEQGGDPHAVALAYNKAANELVALEPTAMNEIDRMLAEETPTSQITAYVESLDPSAQQAAMDYIRAVSAYRGAADSVEGNIEKAVKQERERLTPMAYVPAGSDTPVLTTIRYGSNVVYVKNYDPASPYIHIVDPETGEVKQIVKAEDKNIDESTVATIPFEQYMQGYEDSQSAALHQEANDRLQHNANTKVGFQMQPGTIIETAQGQLYVFSNDGKTVQLLPTKANAETGQIEPVSGTPIEMPVGEAVDQQDYYHDYVKGMPQQEAPSVENAEGEEPATEAAGTEQTEPAVPITVEAAQNEAATIRAQLDEAGLSDFADAIEQGLDVPTEGMDEEQAALVDGYKAAIATLQQVSADAAQTTEAPAEPAATAEPEKPQIPVDKKTGVKLYELGTPIDEAIKDIHADGLDPQEWATLAVNEVNDKMKKLKKDVEKGAQTRAELLDSKSAEPKTAYGKAVKALAELQQVADYYNQMLDALKPKEGAPVEPVAETPAEEKPVQEEPKSVLDIKVGGEEAPATEVAGTEQAEPAEETAPAEGAKDITDIKVEETPAPIVGTASVEEAKAKNEEPAAEAEGTETNQELEEKYKAAGVLDEEEYNNLQAYENEQETVDTEGGLVRNDVAERALSPRWRGALHALGRRTGKRFVVLDGEGFRKLGIDPKKTGGFAWGNTAYLNERFVSDPENLKQFVIGHEYNHLVKKDNDPRVWNAFADMVKQGLGKEFADKFDGKRKLYDEEYEKYNKRNPDKKPLEKLTDEEIEDEIIGDWVGKELLNRPEEFARMAAKAAEAGDDPEGLTRKILDWIKDVIRRFKKALKIGEPVERDIEALEKAKDIFQQMVNVMAAKNNARKAEIEREAPSPAKMDGVDQKKFSISSLANASGLDAYTEVDNSRVPYVNEKGDVVYKLGDKEFSADNKITVKDLKEAKDSAWNMLFDDAVKYGTISPEKRDRMLGVLADMINTSLEMGSAENGGFGNLQSNWQWVGETVFKTIESNGDPQYRTSLDITRVCKKNEQMIYAISELQNQQGYGVTPAQILDLYRRIDESGYQTPCPVCYVFSRYIRNGKYANAAINGMVTYGEHLPNGNDPWTAERWNEEYKSLEDLKKDKKYSAAVEKANADLAIIPNMVDVLGRKLLEGNLSEEEKTEIEKEIKALDERYRKALDLYSHSSLTNWIKTFALNVGEKGKKSTLRDDIAEKPEDMDDYMEHALDIRKTASVYRKYPAIQRLRKSGGSAAGKEIAFASDNYPGEVALGIGRTGENGGRNLDNLFERAAKTTDPAEREKLLKKAYDEFGKSVTIAARQSLRGGQRMWSWSDNIERLAADIMQSILQMESVKGAMQAYSKQLEGINLAARMQVYVNGSLIGRGMGYEEVPKSDTIVRDGKRYLAKDIKGMAKRFGKDVERVFANEGSPIYEEDGKYYVATFDDVVGVDPWSHDDMDGHKKGLFELNSELSKAGNIIVGMDDRHIRIVMADGRIYFCIPWHSSGQSVHILQQMMNILGVPFDAAKATDYTKMQEEKQLQGLDETNQKAKGWKSTVITPDVVALWEDIKNNEHNDFACGIKGGVENGTEAALSDSQKHYRELRSAIIDGSIYGNKKWLKEAKDDAFLGQMMETIKRVVPADKDGISRMDSGDNNYMYPYEYWDTSSTFETADINGLRYLEYCRRLGRRPKFSGRWTDGRRDPAIGNFIGDTGYWKLLIDRRMYDVDGEYQDLDPVNSDEILAKYADPRWTSKNFRVTEVANNEATKGIVDDVREQERERFGDNPSADYANITPEKAAEDYEKAVKDTDAEYKKAAKAVEKIKKEQPRFSISEKEKKPATIEDILFGKKGGGIQQGFGSAGTSLNQIPSGMKKIEWEPGTVNVDIGGGRFDTATKFMEEKGVKNLVFDPFNRDAEHNKDVAEYVRDNKADTATCHNVLNVIDSEGSRANVILQAAKAIKPDGTAYFTVYEGDKSGNGRQTKTDSWQNNRPTKDYVGEIEKYFDDVKVKNNVIIAKEPKQTEEQSVWDFDGNYGGNDIRFSLDGDAIEAVGQDKTPTIEDLLGTKALEQEFIDRAEQRATDIADKLGTKVNVVKDIKDVPKGDTRKALRSGRKILGWYDTDNGEVSVYLPNITDFGQIDKTCIHEIVAHKGLRELLGEKGFNKLCDAVYASMDDASKERFGRYAGIDRFEGRERERAMADEYIAKLAEKADLNNSVWARIVASVREFLRDAGFNIKMTDKDISDLLRRSYERLTKKSAADKGEVAQNEWVTDREVRVINGDGLRIGGEGMKGFYDQMLPRFMDKYGKKWGVKTREVELPGLDGQTAEHPLTMWSVDVTPEMKESVMQGQPMFSISPDASEDERVVREYDAGAQTLAENVTNGMIRLSEENRDSTAKKVAAVRSIGARLSDINKAMRAQKEYDKGTVDSLVRLTKILAANTKGLLSKYEEAKIWNSLANVVGKKNTTEEANNVVDIMLDAELRTLHSALKKIVKTKGVKLNSSGVETMGRLDIPGQRLVEAFKDGIKSAPDDLSDRIYETLGKLGEDDLSEKAQQSLEAELRGLELAQRYQEDVQSVENDIRGIMRDISLARKDPESVGIKKGKERAGYIRDLRHAATQAKLDLIPVLSDITAALSGEVKAGSTRAKRLREEDLLRKQDIWHAANSDLKGISNDMGERKETIKDKVADLSILRFLTSPLATFDEMLRYLGGSAPRGEGRLFNRFMPQFTAASDKEYKSMQKNRDVLDKKLSEVFGKDMDWSDIYRIEKGMPTVPVTVKEGKEEKTYDLTQGNIAYIYASEKQPDGKVKLRNMGISEEDVEALTEKLDPRLKEIVDWLQEEFLPAKRKEYNEVHERMFGAPMADIENYFPIVTNSLGRGQDFDVKTGSLSETKPSTITGSIIKRKWNRTPLDITRADAFDVAYNHLQDMEHWAAFAEFSRDLNTLINYPGFRKKLQNMSSLRYGSGKNIYETFKKVATIASGEYHPTVSRNSADNAVVNIAKGVTMAKISFRLFTAAKQLLSSPAYLTEASVPNIVKHGTPITWAQDWNWAMENLPGFKKRWMSRQAGDYRLKKDDLDWTVWNQRLVEKLSKIGMTPNAFVDAMTVAIGARAIYDTAYNRMVKDGVDSDVAKKRALDKASISVNETQQSSENAYLAPIQVDRTAMSAAFTTFRNASMGYERRLVRSIADLKNRTKKGYRDRAIEQVMKQAMAGGLDEEQARKAAKKVYNRAKWRDMADVAVFGYIMQFFWNAAPYLPLLLLGGDDDDKKDAIKDITTHSLFGSIEGLTGGNWASDNINNIINGEWYRVLNNTDGKLPIEGDIQNILKDLHTDEYAAVVDVVHLLMQAGIGVNPANLSDWVAAIMDAGEGLAGDGGNGLEKSEEIAMLLMRLAEVPKSATDKFFMDKVFKENPRNMEPEQLDALLKRYTDYKRNSAEFLIRPLRDFDEESSQKADAKWAKRFETEKKNRMKMLSDKGDYELIQEFEKDALKEIKAKNKNERTPIERKLYHDYNKYQKFFSKSAKEYQADQEKVEDFAHTLAGEIEKYMAGDEEYGEVDED